MKRIDLNYTVGLIIHAELKMTIRHSGEGIAKMASSVYQSTESGARD